MRDRFNHLRLGSYTSLLQVMTKKNISSVTNLQLTIPFKQEPQDKILSYPVYLLLQMIDAAYWDCGLPEWKRNPHRNKNK